MAAVPRLERTARTMLTNDSTMEYSPEFGVSDAVALFNQILDTATPTITVVGEVGNFKVNHGKWVFFDLKDEESSLGCFMSAFQLRVPIENGMQIKVVARPNLTRWGKFSLTVQSMTPVGEGSIRKAFDLLKSKLESEGLFAPERKRSLPDMPQTIGVISSTDAAGYVDFVKILNQRLGGLKLVVVGVQVQGDPAPDQIIAALEYLNGMATPPEVIAIIRGGGSRDDLAVFDDEPLVRAIAASRVPTISGIGHEIDTTLADLAADVRAATPSNAAQLLVPDRKDIIAGLDNQLEYVISNYKKTLESQSKTITEAQTFMLDRTRSIVRELSERQHNLQQVLRQLDPRLILNRGYAIVRDQSGSLLKSSPEQGDNLTIESAKLIIETEVKNVTSK